MKLPSLLLAGLLALGTGYASAQAPAPAGALPASPAISAENITPEEQAALNALQTALAAATTPEQKAQILADAIALTPTLASKPALQSSLQSTAIQSGMSISQVDTAIITGLANVQSPAAGGQPSGQNIPASNPVAQSNTSTGGGGGSGSGG